ncbi:hypothetical protein [Paenibacillus campi]|uniref:hypothetical protein n=1 Tax=Paenibacillus campi TaxID=3106031 RepID=UPI002AFFE753|nr:hypothetical protein [Paenibacillus sp. SGZ-1009]
MIYFVRKSEVGQLPSDPAELQYRLRQMVGNNEAISIDRMAVELQMESVQLLMGNPVFTPLFVQGEHVERFLRSPLHGYASEVYVESLELVTAYLRELQEEIMRVSDVLTRYHQDTSTQGSERDSVRQLLIDLGERREVLMLVLQEMRNRIDTQMQQEKERLARYDLDGGWSI